MRATTAAVLLLSVATLLFSACDDAKRDDAGAIVEGGDVGVQSLRVGDCFQDWEGALSGEIAQLTNLSAVPCGEPHDNEVYHLFDVASTSSFPGDASLESAAQEGCLGPFEAYVGIGYLDSRLDFRWIIPSLDSWDEGDREIICFLYDIEYRPLVDSMRDSRT